MDILYYCSGDFTPWTADACAERNYGPHKLLPKSDMDERTERQRYRQMGGYISSTGPHWDPSDPSVGINSSRRCTPHWKLIQIQKLQKERRWLDGWTHYTATQGISPRSLWQHALHVIMSHANDRQKSTRTTRQRDI